MKNYLKNYIAFILHLIFKKILLQLNFITILFII